MPRDVYLKSTLFDDLKLPGNNNPPPPPSCGSFGIISCVCVFLLMDRLICLFVCMFVCLYICLFVRLFVHLYVCMYVCMFVCLFVCMFYINLGLYRWMEMEVAMIDKDKLSRPSEWTSKRLSIKNLEPIHFTGSKTPTQQGI